MAGRITGPYRGFFINAEATLSGQQPPHYVGALSLTEHGVDEPRKLERLVPLGDATAFPDNDAALKRLETEARQIVDALFDIPVQDEDVRPGM
ncbi:hypothetical protein [Robbsia sp. KACC 23696]|uniref:hypothetical protein n=1 Tax=Robbsia sp. KACC 23696 TaxID=3149231 RepID=UPI00325B19E6